MAQLPFAAKLPAKPISRKADRLDPKLRKSINVFVSLILPVALVCFWHYVTVNKIFPPVFMPTLTKIWSAFLKQANSGLIWRDTGVTLKRVLEGYLIGALLAIVLGVLMGISATVNRLFSGILNGIRQIPGLAFIPLFIIWFGIGNTTKLVMVAKGTFFPVLVNTIDGVRSTNRGFIELSKLYKVSRFDLIRKVYIPSSLPYIFTGLRLGAGVAWMSVVAAEMFASTEGLGYRITFAQTNNDSPMLLVDMLVIGIIGGLMDYILRIVIARLTRWQRAGSK